MAGSKPKLYFVDGRWVTLYEMAAELGLKPRQLSNQMYRGGGGSLNVAVQRIRNNLAMNGHKCSERHMVDGKWTTIAQEAEKLGVSYSALQHYVKVHGCTLAEAVGNYRERRVRHGAFPRVEIVNGREMTVADVAREAGVADRTVYWHRSRKGMTLKQIVKYYERKKAEEAARRIMDILKGP